MAGRAVGVLGVRLNALPDGDLVAGGWHGLDGIDIGRWRRRGFVEDGFANPNTAMHRAMASAVRSEAEHGAHRQQPTPMILGLERHTLETTGLRLGQTIEIAEPGVGHRPVRIKQALDGEVLGEQFAEILDRLIAHADLEPIIIAGVEFLVRRKHAHAMQLQPLAREVINETVDPVIRQHPVHRLFQVVAL